MGLPDRPRLPRPGPQSMSRSRVFLLVVTVVAAGCGAAPRGLAEPEWVPFPERQVHPCSPACCCGCGAGKACTCDGRRCLVEVTYPAGDRVQVEVGREDLPGPDRQCCNRPL